VAQVRVLQIKGDEMKNRFFFSLMIAILALLSSSPASAQDNSSVAVRKFELAADFTSLTFNPSRTEIGLGGRLTYNLNSKFALEGAAYFFPHDCNFCGRQSGQTTEGLLGVKVGKRFHKWGLFGKARPGVISSSKGKLDLVALSTPQTDPPSFGLLPTFVFTERRLTSFALDVGGVLEFYPSKRIVTRLDFGSTIIHYGKQTTRFASFNPLTGAFTLVPTTIPAQTGGTFQVVAGVGFRF